MQATDRVVHVGRMVRVLTNTNGLANLEIGDTCVNHSRSSKEVVLITQYYALGDL